MSNRYIVSQAAEPAAEPVSVAEFKSFLRITHDSEDSVLADYLKAARLFCENYTGKAFISRAYKIIFDRLDDPNIIPLVKMPLVSVSTVKTYDLDNITTTVSSDDYSVDVDAGRILMKYGAVLNLPARDTRILEVDFTAGFGAAASDVPESIKQAILMKATQMYEERGDVPVSAPFDMIAALLKPYKKIGAV